jgi:hypothetical protein
MLTQLRCHARVACYPHQPFRGHQPQRNSDSEVGAALTGPGSKRVFLVPHLPGAATRRRPARCVRRCRGRASRAQQRRLASVSARLAVVPLRDHRRAESRLRRRAPTRAPRAGDIPRHDPRAPRHPDPRRRIAFGLVRHCRERHSTWSPSCISSWTPRGTRSSNPSDTPEKRPVRWLHHVG